MTSSLVEQAEKRSLLLSHRLLAKIPREALESLLLEGCFLTLAESEILDLPQLSDALYFVLEGQLGLFIAKTHSFICLFKENEDVFRAPWLGSQDSQAIVLSSQAQVFRLGWPAFEAMLLNFPQAEQFLWPCQQSLGSYYFCKSLHLTSPPAPELLAGLKLELFAAQDYIFNIGAPSEAFT